ncbi:MAG: hypothetical protein RSA26_06515, partial [Mucinivorans sp.]
MPLVIAGLVLSQSRLKKRSFQEPVQKKTNSLGADSEKRSFQEQLRKTKCPRTNKKNAVFKN